MAVPSVLRRWLAFGQGVGIEIAGPAGAETLRIAAVRARPSGVQLLGQMTVEDAPHQAAGAWGTQYSNFLRKHGIGHVAAAILLPRRDVIVRQLALPGVADQDLKAAVEFQLDGLHPYSDDDAVSSWARVGDSSTVVVAVTRRTVIERYLALFAEAGIKVYCFTCSAAAILSARHMLGTPASGEVLAFLPQGGETPSGTVEADPSIAGEELRYDGVELYGESAWRPLFSASFDMPFEQAVSLAASEMHLAPETPVQSLDVLLGGSPALPYAAAQASACPHLTSELNLLSPQQRQSDSRTFWVPSAVLAAAALLLVAALISFPKIAEGRYLASLESEMERVAPQAARAASLDQQIEHARRNTLLLDEIRSRSKADMDVLSELTHLLAPPAWLNTLEITRTQVNFAGETNQAAPLLSTIDASPLFQGSEFTSPPLRTSGGEAFRIRANRETGTPVTAPDARQQVASAPVTKESGQ